MRVPWRKQRGSAAHADDPLEDVRPRLAVVYDSVAFASDTIDSQTIPADFERLWPEQALALLDDEYRANFLAIFTDSGAQPWAQRALEQAHRAKLTTHLLRVSEAMKRRLKRDQRGDQRVSGTPTCPPC